LIAIIDYNAGNLTSVKRALDHLGIASAITPDPAAVAAAERVIFPGVGHAAAAMKTLRERGLDDALRQAYDAGTPILGICLGTQIILSHSEEGDTSCLGLIEGTVPRFSLSDPLLKVPHMGWDSIVLVRGHPVLRDLREGDEFYFVHSFFPKPARTDAVIATCGYEQEFAAIIGERNLIGTQFHPEKSGPAGLTILKNFSQWDGAPC
jgi:glutamine amidotransferase